MRKRRKRRSLSRVIARETKAQKRDWGETLTTVAVSTVGIVVATVVSTLILQKLNQPQVTTTVVYPPGSPPSPPALQQAPGATSPGAPSIITPAVAS